MPPCRLLAVAPLMAAPLAAAVIITNHERTQVNAPHDVHDGTISRWTADGPFYWYGMGYTDCRMNSGWLSPVYTGINWLVSTLAPLAATCNGFNCAPIAFHRFGVDCGFLTAAQGQTVRVFSSYDLLSWEEAAAPALDVAHPLLRDAVLFRPAVIFNPTTRKYVLWINRIPRGYSVWDGYTRGGYIVAEADASSGPFVIKDRQPEMEFGGGGDYALLADGARAWIAYGSWDNGYRTEGIHKLLPAELNAGHRIAVQPLSEDFTTTAPSVAASTVTAPDQEAPTLFKRDGLYYLLHGDVCCFCPQGSDAKVLVAADPMGNWSHVSNLNPYGGAHVRGQSNSVIEVPLANGSTQLVWTADLWQSGRSGAKGDDVQFWYPLEFDMRSDTGVTQDERVVAVPRSVRWVDSFELQLPPAPNKAAAAGASDCAARDELAPSATSVA